MKRKSNSKVDRITLVRTRKCKKHWFNIDKNIDAREIERKQATKVSNYFARVDNCVDDYKQKGDRNHRLNHACQTKLYIYFRTIQQYSDTRK